MGWTVSHRFDIRAKRLADRHYNRQKPDSPQFVPPGMHVVLLTECQKAVWITSWPDYVRHDWPDTWNNTLFRNEGAGRASDLILEALDASAEYWQLVPLAGCVTFVNPSCVEGIKVRGVTIYGFCYMKAGFRHVGFTKVHKYWVWHKDLT